MMKRFRSGLLILRNVACLILFLLLLFVYNINKLNINHIKSKLSKNAMKFIDFQEQNYVNPLPIDAIKILINKCNSEERILNMDIYGPVKTDAPVFVIFVGKYKANLKYLLASLNHVVGIADALIIFSHSHFDENVNALIKTIDFARVVQIYYPYSLQIFAGTFPGFQPGDCTRYMGTDLAREIDCIGANSPDIHGLYRDPVLAQTKHFWWWTANYVFDVLSHTKMHQGIFIFLDDDVFLIEDFIYMTLHMKKTSKLVSQCDFVSLDSSSDPNFFNTNTYGAYIKTWDPLQHSGVLAFDSKLWNSISSQYYLFCEVDDYSWARSLLYLSLNRKDGNRFRVISSTMPRAFKTSKLSHIYKQLTEYNILDIVNEILKMQKRNHGNFFPAQLEVFLDIELEYDAFVFFDYVDNNGGWSDPRDRQMCSNLTVNKVKKIILDMDSQFNHYKNDDDTDEYEVERVTKTKKWHGLQ